VELEKSLGVKVEDINVEELMKGIERFADELGRTTRTELLQSFIWRNS